MKYRDTYRNPNYSGIACNHETPKRGIIRVTVCVPVFLFLFAANAFAAQVLEGTILNGTTQKPGAAELVTLISLGQGMQEVAHVRDVQGKFSFDLAKLSRDAQSGPFMFRATYKGVNYFKPMMSPEEAQKPQQVTVFDQVPNMEGAVVKLPHFFIKRDQDRLLCSWNFEIENPTKATMHKLEGLFPVTIPDGAEEIQVSASSGTMPVKVGLTRGKQPGLFYLNYPFKPGKSSMQLSYALDYKKEQAVLEPRLHHPIAKVMALIYPEDMRVDSEGMQELQVDAQQRLKVVAWQGLTPDKPWRISLSGGSKLSAPDMSQQGMQGHNHGDEGDQKVVEKPPAIASVRWLIWGIMIFGFLINTVAFLRRRKNGAASSFEFSQARAYREKLAQCGDRQKQQALLKEAWNQYLQEKHAD